MSNDSTHWVDDDRSLQRVVDTLRSEPEYGLDTEFMAEKTYYPQLCLVQLSWPAGVALVDPFACDVRALAALLAEPSTMVTHAGGADLPIIERACGARPRAVFDTQLAAGFVGLGQPSLVSLVQSVLDVHLDKGDQLADWTRRPLSASARRYGAGDVAHLLPLAAALRQRIDDLGRAEWVAAESEILLRTPSRDADPEIAWWRIKGARSLRGRRACVAQAVAAWRERRAQETDRPARFVVSDLTLAAVVQRPPSDTDELAHIRGAGSLPRAVTRGILDAIEQGRAMDPADLREPPRHGDDPSLEAAVGLLTGWAAQVAGGERVDARLLATREDVKAVVNGRPSRLDDGWRAAMIGEDVHALVNGDAVIRLVGGGRRLSLERRPDRSE
ncbi:MAG TPA: HRDC domain-containing protein [Acidimicrobiia bacterium]